MHLKRLLFISVLLGLQAARPANAQTVEGYCGIETQLVPSPVMVAGLPGTPVPSEESGSLVWPPRANVDELGTIPAPPSQRIVMSAPVREGETVVGWILLTVADDVAADSFADWLIETSSPRMHFWWVSDAGAAVEILDAQSDNEIYDDWAPPHHALEEATRIRVQGTRLLELCYPSVYTMHEDIEYEVDTVDVVHTCHEFADFIDNEGRFDRSAERIESHDLPKDDPGRAHYRALRDLDGDGAFEVLTFEYRRGREPDYFRDFVPLSMAYVAGDGDAWPADEALPLTQQPLWAESLERVARPGASVEMLESVLSRLIFLAASALPEDDIPQLSCVTELTTLRLVRRALDTMNPIEAWGYVNWARDDVPRAAFADFLVQGVQALPWHVSGLGEVKQAAWSQDGSQLRLQTERGQLVCSDLDWRCRVDADQQLGTTPAENSGVECLVAHENWRDDNVHLTVAFCASDDCDNLESCACDATWDEDIETWSTPIDFPLDGHTNISGSDCGWGGEVEPGLGIVGKLDETRLLLAAQARFYVFTRDGLSPIDASEVPTELRPWAGLDDTLSQRLFLVRRGTRTAVWRADLATELLELVVEIPGTETPAFPRAHVIPSPSGERFVVIIDNKLIGVYTIADDAPAMVASHDELPSQRPGPLLRRATDGMPLAYIGGGTFTMGIDDGTLQAHQDACRDGGSRRCSEGRFEGERPGISVTVDAFLLDRYEVARRQYEMCRAAGACPPVDEATCQVFDGDDWGTGRDLQARSLRADAPRTCVTRAEAEAYCAWAEGRLPTEAEWEWAASGDTARLFAWGDGYDETRVNDLAGPPELSSAWSHPSGSTPAGVSHLSGNAYEWVADDACDFADHPGGLNPTCRVEDGRGVVRGGSFASDAGGIRTTYRRFQDPTVRVDTNGFRCAMAPEVVNESPETLRGLLGLPEDTPVGDVEVDDDGQTHLTVSIDGIRTTLATAWSPMTALDCRTPEDETHSMWWVFAGSPPVALELGETLRLWSVDSERGCTVGWDPLESRRRTLEPSALEESAALVSFEVDITADLELERVISYPGQVAVETASAQPLMVLPLPDQDALLPLYDVSVSDGGQVYFRFMGEDTVNVWWVPEALRPQSVFHNHTDTVQEYPLGRDQVSSQCWGRQRCRTAAPEQLPIYRDYLSTSHRRQEYPTPTGTLVRREIGTYHVVVRFDADLMCGIETTTRQVSREWSIEAAAADPILLDAWEGEDEVETKECSFERQ